MSGYTCLIFQLAGGIVSLADCATMYRRNTKDMKKYEERRKNGRENYDGGYTGRDR
jgi:hypothetical protein